MVAAGAAVVLFISRRNARRTEVVALLCLLPFVSKVHEYKLQSRRKEMDNRFLNSQCLWKSNFTSTKV